MAKRSTGPATPSAAEAAPPAEAPAPAAPAGGAAAKPPGLAEPTVREWVNDDRPFEGMHGGLEAALADAPAEGDGAAAAGTAPAATATPDPDATPPEEGAPAAAAAPASAAETPVYLTAAQRAELMAKVDQDRAKLGLETTLQAAQAKNAELEEKLAKAASGKLADLLEVAGVDRATALEELLLTGAEATAEAPKTDPKVAQLERELQALKDRDAKREKDAQDAQARVVKAQAVQRVTAIVEANATEFPMVVALGHGEQVHDEAVQIWTDFVKPGTPGDQARAKELKAAEIAQVAAQRIEERLRGQHPRVWAALGGGAAPAPAATAAAPAATAVTTAPARPAPAVGARTAAPAAEPELDIAPDDPARHQKIKAMLGFK
jgi:hypothetical protein